MLAGLEIEADIEVVGECDDGDLAIGTIRDLTPDVVFVGMQVAQTGGVRTTAGIREVVPNCKVVIVLSNDDLGEGIRAVRAGASGFLSRDDAVPRAALTTRQVFSGQVILPPAVAGQVLAEFDVIARPSETTQAKLVAPAFTDAERRSLEDLRDAIPADQSASGLEIPVSSVHNLAASAITKLHRFARSEAVLYTAADKVYGFS